MLCSKTFCKLVHSGLPITETSLSTLDNGTFFDTTRTSDSEYYVVLMEGSDNQFFRFRSDYFKIYQDRTGQELNGFKRFMSTGVRAEYLESVFPAETFPALQTIQTGRPIEQIDIPCMNLHN